jgi:electron transport complex protein RnfB
MKRERVAVVDEARCIGCTLCIAACPVDAIAGARGLMHTVIGQYCIGCDLCVPPCPVDCIEMVPAPSKWTPADALAAKRRARQRKARLLSEASIPAVPAGQRKAAVAEAIERARIRRSVRGGTA